MLSQRNGLEILIEHEPDRRRIEGARKRRVDLGKNLQESPNHTIQRLQPGTCRFDFRDRLEPPISSIFDNERLESAQRFYKFLIVAIEHGYAEAFNAHQDVSLLT